MKKILLVVLLTSGLSLCGTAQEKEKIKDKDVPAAVQTTFNAEYPEAKDIEWKLKDGHYKVAFEVNGTNQIASFDSIGKLLSKGIEIKEAELPAAVTSAIRSGYVGRTIETYIRLKRMAP